MKALWIAVASVGLLTACSGGTAPVETTQPGPGAGESPSPNPGKGAEAQNAPLGSRLRDLAVQKLEGECKVTSGADVLLAGHRVDSDSEMLAGCAAECVLDSTCEDITAKDREHNVYWACISSCAQ